MKYLEKRKFWNSMMLFQNISKLLVTYKFPFTEKSPLENQNPKQRIFPVKHCILNTSHSCNIKFKHKN